MKNIRQIISSLKDDIKENKISTTAVPSGFPELDKKTSGFQNGQLIVIAGRPGMGSTAMSLSIVKNMVKNTDKRIAYFSLQYTATQLVKRYFGIRAEKTLEALNKLDEEIINDSFFIDDNQYRSIFELIDQISIIKHECAIDLVVIDNLLSMLPDWFLPASENKNLETTIRVLKTLSQSLNIPILLTWRVTREIEKKLYKIPRQLLYLYGYREIGQFLDVVLFVYRWDYYGIQFNEEGESVDNKGLIVVAKNRSGSGNLAEITVEFDSRNGLSFKANTGF